jgi:hypothetical protein
MGLSGYRSVTNHFCILVCWPSPQRAGFGLGEVDDFPATPIENGFDHEQAKTPDLVDGYRRTHGEFPAAHGRFNKGGPS